MTCCRRLDPVADPFLREHRIRGFPSVAGAFVIEAMAEAVLFLTGQPGFRIEQAVLTQPIMVKLGRSQDMFLDLIWRGDQVEVVVSVDVVAPNGTLLATRQERGRGVFRLTSSQPFANSVTPGQLLSQRVARFDPLAYMAQTTAVADVGPSYLQPHETWRLSDGSLALWMKQPEDSTSLLGRPNGTLYCPPIMLVAASAMFYMDVYERTGDALLVTDMSDISVDHVAAPGAGLFAWGRVWRTGQEGYAADLLIMEPDGRPVLRLGRMGLTKVMAQTPGVVTAAVLDPPGAPWLEI